MATIETWLQVPIGLIFAEQEIKQAAIRLKKKVQE